MEAIPLFYLSSLLSNFSGRVDEHKRRIKFSPPFLHPNVPQPVVLFVDGLLFKTPFIARRSWEDMMEDHLLWRIGTHFINELINMCFTDSLFYKADPDQSYQSKQKGW